MSVEPAVAVRKGLISALVSSASLVLRAPARHWRGLLLGVVVLTGVSLLTSPVVAAPASVATDGPSSIRPSPPTGEPALSTTTTLAPLGNATNTTALASLETATNTGTAGADTGRAAATVTTTTDTVGGSNRTDDVATDTPDTTLSAPITSAENGVTADSESVINTTAIGLTATGTAMADGIAPTVFVRFTVEDAQQRHGSPENLESGGVGVVGANATGTPRTEDATSELGAATLNSPDSEVDQPTGDGDGDVTTHTESPPTTSQRSGTVPFGLGGIVGAGAVLVAGWRCSSAGGLVKLSHAGGIDRVVSVGHRQLAGLLDHLRPVLGLAGYQRYEDDDPLAHPTRGAIYDRIQTEPGVYLSALAEATDTPLGTVRYHLKILEFEGLVTRANLNGRRRYYPLDVEPGVIETLLDDSAAHAVLAELADGGPASVGDLAERVGCDPSTITHHTTRLADMGLVERERDGRTTRNRLTDEGLAAVRSTRVQSRPADHSAPSVSASTD